MQQAAPGSYVAVLGASTKEDRYSNKAVKMLLEHGHRPIPVHPAAPTVHDVPGVKSLDDIREDVDTLTVYVGPKISSDSLDSILELHPRRVVFNPGAENEELAVRLEAAGIEVLRACTLVLLRTSQF